MSQNEQEKFCRALEASLGPLADKVAADFIVQCWRHWQLLLQWNQKINLTAILEPEEGALLHYRDSIEALDKLEGDRVVDFGSGAGFPGIPLALALPQKHFTLVEARRKRASFLRVAKSTLDIKNIDILNCRAEDTPSRQFDSAVTRATFSQDTAIQGLFRWLGPCAPLVVFRTAGDEPEGVKAEKHDYVLMQRKRTLEIWHRKG